MVLLSIHKVFIRIDRFIFFPVLLEKVFLEILRNNHGIRLSPFLIKTAYIFVEISQGQKTRLYFQKLSIMLLRLYEIIILFK